MTDSGSETAAGGPHGYQPGLRDLIRLELPVGVRISPDGARVAYRVRSANWKDNGYDIFCRVYDTRTRATQAITRSGSATQVEWVDDRTLAVLKKGPCEDDKPQVWLFEGLAGEGWQVTDHKTGVDWFMPFAGGLLFKASNPERDEKKERSEQWGKFIHFEEEDSPAALYYTGLEALRRYQAQVRDATEDQAKGLVAPVIELSRLLPGPLSIQEVIPSPLHEAVYINCWPHDDLVYYRDTTTFRIELDAPAALAEYLRREEASKERDKAGQQNETNNGPAAGASPSGDAAPHAEDEDTAYLGKLTRLNLPRGASVTAVSPDARTLLVAHRERDIKMYTREDLWTLPLEAALQAADPATCLASMHNLSAALDQEMLDRYWIAAGIFVSYVEGTHMRVAQLHEKGSPQPLDLQGIFPALEIHTSAAGRLALVGANAQSFPEVYLASPAGEGAAWTVEKLTGFGQALEGWDLGTVETIRWKSKDGVEIEGVLRKPAGFDPSRKYPLAFVVHGGPTWFSPEYLLNGDDLYYYPTVQFVNKGVLVLKPNYRGSIGRGQAFTELNVNNLGVGDLWDLESAIDHLVELGWVDPNKIGCMGWSQGGYISAFAGLHSERFQAVSVGAGISDWYTYHISNDIPDFTTDYLSSSPFRSREHYARTAPISNISNARTPMLIQHGSEDRRVPLSNATELYRGLKEMGVPVTLFIFPGMAHPITRPRENHAVLHQNLAWFGHYLLDEQLSELT